MSKMADCLFETKAEELDWIDEIDIDDGSVNDIDHDFELEIRKEAENIELLKASIDKAWERNVKRLKGREKEIRMLVNVLGVCRDETKRCWLQIKNLEAKSKNEFENFIDDKRKLVDELKDCRYENEIYKMQVKYLQEKYDEANDDFELSMEDKRKLVDELKACKDENEVYKMQIKDLQVKYKDDFEICMEEKCKLVDELEASREEVERYKKGLENLKSTFREVSMDALSAKEALFCAELENLSYKKRIQTHEFNMRETHEAWEELMLAYQEASSNEMEVRDALFHSRLENENYQMEIDRVHFIMNEEKMKYEKQIEDLTAKNEKNESTLNDLILGDWKLVEEQEEEQLDHN